MLKLWAEAGFNPVEFWQQTPRLLQHIFAGYAEREKAARHGRMYAAWHTAAFFRSKKMPKLREVLDDKPQRTAQTPAEMIAMMQSLVKE